LHEHLLELADGAAAVARLFDKPEDAAATTVLTDVESSLRKLAETFAHGVAEG
jgi:hypothetical protein